MRAPVLLLFAALWGCTSSGGASSGGSGGGSSVCGADAGGCIEDTTIQGVCAQDRPHMCFCTPTASPPDPNCIGNAVKPYTPYTHALCCP
jgi:hypothetical protein